MGRLVVLLVILRSRHPESEKQCSDIHLFHWPALLYAVYGRGIGISGICMSDIGIPVPPLSSPLSSPNSSSNSST